MKKELEEKKVHEDAYNKVFIRSLEFHGHYASPCDSFRLINPGYH